MSEIARQAGVDEASVRRIKAGRYQVYHNKKMLAAHERMLALSQRCPQCGGLIYIVPCRLCTSRQKIEAIKDLCSCGNRHHPKSEQHVHPPAPPLLQMRDKMVLLGCHH